MRKLILLVDVDENFPINEDIGTIDYLEREFGWLNDSGIYLNQARIDKPVNVYGSTSYYERGQVECVYDGFGFRDKDGNITWYDGYNPPKDDEFHLTTIVPYGNGADLSEMP